MQKGRRRVRRWGLLSSGEARPSRWPAGGEQLKRPGRQRTESTTVIWGHLPFDKVATGSHIQFMCSVGLKTLKNRLSEYVRLAAGRERL
jgi:hypothetical protein